MQEGIIGIAGAMGTLEANSTSAEEVQGDFNASLEKNWLSADVMSTYLKIMAEDTYESAKAMAVATGLSDEQADTLAKQAVTANEAATKVRTLTQLYGTMQEAVGSGWSQSFDTIVGDFDEATELFTNVNDTLGGLIGAASDARNKIITEWADNGGRASAIEGIASAFNILMSILGPIKDAFQEVFPPATGTDIANITKSITAFINGLKPGEKALADIKSTAKGFFALLDIGVMVIVGFVKMVAELLGVASQGTGGFLDFTGGVGEFIVKVRDAIKSGEGISTFFEKLGGVLKTIFGVFGMVIGIFGDFATSTGDIAKGGFDGFLEKVGARVESIRGFFASALDVVKAFGRGVEVVAEFFEPFLSKISELAKGLGGAITDSFDSGNFNTALDFLNTGLLAGIGVIIYKFVDKLKGMFKKVDPGTGLKDVIKGVFGELGNTMQTLQGQIKAKTLMLIAGAIAILTLSVIALSLIDTAKLAIALGAITVMFGQLAGAMAAFDAMFSLKSAAKLTILAAAMVGIATAMLILSGAIAIMGSLSWNQLAKGLVGLAGGLAIMAGAMLLMSKVGPGAILGSIGLVIASAGILLLAGALKVMATLSWDDIGRAMVVLGGTLIILAIGLTAMAGSLPGAAALVIASVGLTVIAGALLLFAQLSWDDIGRAMTVLGATLIILAIGLTAMVGALPGAAALVVASVGLSVIAGVLLLFAQLSWEDIGQAMVAIGGTLLILAIGLTAMVAAGPGALALIVAAGALAILAPVLMLLGSMSWETIWTGLGALALTLGLLAIAGIALIPALPGLLGLGAAAVLLGIGVLAAGLGVMALAAGLAVLAVAGGAAVTVLVAAITSIATLIPFVLSQIGLGLIEIIKIVGQNGPAILQALTVVLLALIQAIIAVIPQIVGAIILLVKTLVMALVSLIPLLVVAGMKLIIGILDGVAKNIPKIIVKGVDIIIALLEGIGKAIPRLLKAGADLIIDLINGLASTIRSRTNDINAAGRNLAGAIVDGMTSGLRNAGNTIWNAAKALVDKIPAGIKKVLGIASPSKVTTKLGFFTGQGLAVGLDKSTTTIIKSAASVGKTTAVALKKSMAAVGSTMSLSMDMTPTIRPVLDLSGIKKDAGLIGSIVGRQTLAVDGATARANEISAKYGDYQQIMADGGRPTTEVNMVQNNYSPKALPATEIYRQNKNQMSILKGELEKNA
jgi:hypothetical protein